MAGYFNNPEETVRALRTHGRGRALASYRRSRLPGRRLVSFHRGSAERPDQNERISGLAARDRGSARLASGRAGSGRCGRSGRSQRGSRESVGCKTCRSEPYSRRAARILPAEARALQNPCACGVQGYAAEEYGRESPAQSACRRTQGPQYSVASTRIVSRLASRDHQSASAMVRQ